MSETDSHLDFIRVLTRALPAEYRDRFDAFAIADHARLVSARGDRPIVAGAYRSPESRGTAVCLVADRRETLLTALSRATVVTGLDVAEGEAYTLDHRIGLRGVMGLFTLRPRGALRALSVEELTLFLDVVSALGSGSRDPIPSPAKLRALRALPADSAREAALSTRVRFREGVDGNLSALEIETDLSSGLVRHLIEILLAERFEIVECEVQSTGGRVFDRFRLVERNGASVSPSRWLDLQTRVLEAVSQVSGGTPIRTGALA